MYAIRHPRALFAALAVAALSLPLLGCTDPAAEAMRRQQAQQQLLDQQQEINQSFDGLTEMLRQQQEMDRILDNQRAFEEYLRQNPIAPQPAAVPEMQPVAPALPQAAYVP